MRSIDRHLCRHLLSLTAALCLGVSGCSKEPIEPNPKEPTGGNPDDFAPLSSYLDNQLSKGALHGYAMLVFDKDDALVYERSDGICTGDSSACPGGEPEFTVDLSTGIASATKWVTSTTILAALDETVGAGRFSSVEEALDARLATELACEGDIGPYAQITLRQILSFTDGILAEHECVGVERFKGGITGCACTILVDSAKSYVSAATSGAPKKNGHPPGKTFKYGETHHTVAAAIVERLTGEHFVDTFERLIRKKLGVELQYRGDTNPNLAGSIHTSPLHYAAFVRAIFHDGREGTETLLSPSAIAAQRTDQWRSDVVILNGPQPGMRYGLNNWRWCNNDLPSLLDVDDPSEIAKDYAPNPDCAQMFMVGHGGKGGYTPWIDVREDYYAVFSMREPSSGGGDDYSDTDALNVTVRLMTSQIMASRRRL
jgi:CubicO group peptidase (beta-lactamase class C family)